MFKDVIGLSYHTHSFIGLNAFGYEREIPAHDGALYCSLDRSTRDEQAENSLSEASLEEQDATMFVHALIVPVITRLTTLEQNTYDGQESHIVCQIVSFYLTLHVCAVRRYNSVRRRCSSYPVVVTWRKMHGERRVFQEFHTRDTIN
jgi:hypothetical protein